MKRRLIAAAAVLACCPGAAFAAPGDLDPTFGDRGTTILPVYATTDVTLVQPDGKLLLVGGFEGGDDIVVWRLTPDGSLDRTFDRDGAAVADFGGDDEATAAVLQADGRLVVAGYTTSAQPGSVGAIARFDTDGSLDETFDPGGVDGAGKKLVADFSFLEAVAVQRDGRILVGGGGPSQSFEITRLTPAGSVEKRFEPADFGGSETVSAVAETPDGGVVAAGVTWPPPSSDRNPAIAVARYTEDDVGKTTATLKGDEDLSAWLLRPDGGLTVAGTAGTEDPQMIALRLRPDGKLDDAHGAAVANFDGKDHAVAAAVQPDGRTLVAGTAFTPETLGVSVAAARFGASGALDGSFGSGGMTTFTVGDISRADSAALQPDGKLVIAGVMLKGLVPRMFVARLQADPPPPVAAPPSPPPPVSVARCAGRRATIVGTARRDKLRGTRRADVIVARGGNDRIRGLAGNDLICAGPGNDVVAGGRGRDVLRGEAGRDRLVGGPARDRLIGGAGRDAAKQ